MRYLELLEDEDYRGMHIAPEREGKNSIDDLSDVYPDDVYNPSVAGQYYGHGQPDMDNASASVVASLRNKPNRPVTIYRAVPYKLSNSEQLVQLNKEMDAFMRRHTVPASSTLTGSDWYNDAYERRDQLKNMADIPSDKIGINPGDWVSINRQYAKQHGNDHLHGKFKIVSKKVKAKEIVTDANSIHEWGYAPS